MHSMAAMLAERNPEVRQWLEVRVMAVSRGYGGNPMDGTGQEIYTSHDIK